MLHGKITVCFSADSWNIPDSAKESHFFEKRLAHSTDFLILAYIEPYTVLSDRPFLSCLLHPYQNESWCLIIHIEMFSPYRFILMQIKLIFIKGSAQRDSFWNWGSWKLGNGLLHLKKSVFCLLWWGCRCGFKALCN